MHRSVDNYRKCSDDVFYYAEGLVHESLSQPRGKEGEQEGVFSDQKDTWLFASLFKLNLWARLTLQAYFQGGSVRMRVTIKVEVG